MKGRKCSPESDGLPKRHDPGLSGAALTLRPSFFLFSFLVGRTHIYIEKLITGFGRPCCAEAEQLSTPLGLPGSSPSRVRSNERSQWRLSKWETGERSRHAFSIVAWLLDTGGGCTETGVVPPASVEPRGSRGGR